MLVLGLVLVFLCGALIVFSLTQAVEDERPTLKLQSGDAFYVENPSKVGKKKNDPLAAINSMAIFLRPAVGAAMRKRLSGNFQVAHWGISPEGFFLIKVLLILGLLCLLPLFMAPDKMIFSVLIAIVVGYIIPEMVLSSSIKKRKGDMVKFLPDVVDLLGLCVSAGLDFMMALKWVVEKSPRNIVSEEMGNLLQEISVGKPRREALRDMAKKYEIPDLSTFARTLIQADKMGTSVSEALTILSEDMRVARFRRGEAIALKAPLKMLGPLLFCIFPVVGILVGAPIFLDFMHNNPVAAMK